MLKDLKKDKDFYRVRVIGKGDKKRVLMVQAGLIPPLTAAMSNTT
jgi:hypothetical protein